MKDDKILLCSNVDVHFLARKLRWETGNMPILQTDWFSKPCKWKKTHEFHLGAFKLPWHDRYWKIRSGPWFSLRLKHTRKFFIKKPAECLHPCVIFNNPSAALITFAFTVNVSVKHGCVVPDGIAFTGTKATLFSNMVNICSEDQCQFS